MGVHDFETILSSNYVMNIQDIFRKGFGYKEILYYIGVNTYFGTRWKNGTHAKPNYGPVKYKFEVGYYRNRYCSQEKVAHIRKNLENQVKK